MSCFILFIFVFVANISKKISETNQTHYLNKLKIKKCIGNFSLKYFNSVVLTPNKFKKDQQSVYSKIFAVDLYFLFNENWLQKYCL